MNSSRLFLYIAILIACEGIYGPLASAHRDAVPLINQPLVPLAIAPGGQGFSLNVKGTGFTHDSVINWNGSPRVTTFESHSQLTAAILASDIAVPTTASVTVTNPAPGGGRSNVAFLQVTNPAPVNFTASNIPGVDFGLAIVAADFNNDGILDVAVADYDSSRFDIFLGNGNGTFEPPIYKATGNNQPDALIVGDFNDDGKLDLAVGFETSTVSVYLGNGNGTFGAPLGLPISNFAAFAVGDFNNDGRLDIIVSGQNGLQVFLGKGNGYFKAPIAIDESATAIAVGDFDNDGNLDFATVSYYGTGYIFGGQGDGTFQHGRVISGTGITTADVNSDGRLDIITVANGELQVYLGGEFDNPIVTPMPFDAIEVVTGDFNGDGKIDLGIVGFDSNTMNLWTSLGNGDGTFQSPVRYTDLFVEAIAPGDFNENGRLDIAVGSDDSLGLYVQ